MTVAISANDATRADPIIRAESRRATAGGAGAARVEVDEGTTRSAVVSTAPVRGSHRKAVVGRGRAA